MSEEVSCPLFFNTIGGTEVFLVRGGPGERASKERSEGKCDLSFKGGDVPTCETTIVQQQTSFELSAMTRAATTSKFATEAGTVFEEDVLLMHDGLSKSVGSFDEILRNGNFANGMVGYDPYMMTPIEWFRSKWNEENKHAVRRIVYVCGTAAIYQILGSFCAFVPRLRMAAGAILQIAFPFVGEPSVSIGMGSSAWKALHWGTVTEEEYDSFVAAGGAGGDMCDE